MNISSLYRQLVFLVKVRFMYLLKFYLKFLSIKVQKEII